MRETTPRDHRVERHSLDGLRDYVPALHATIAPSERGVLLWCRIGRARVTVGTDLFLVGERDAVWIPSGFPVAIASAPGTVVVPIVAHRDTQNQAPFEPVALSVPVDWQPVLLSAFARSLGFLSDGDDADAITPLLPPRDIRGAVLPFPVSADLRAVADRARARPRSDVSVIEWATETRTSVRTLERRFASETGLTIREWRRRVRVDAGLRALAAGSSTTEAALAAGFAGASAFCRSVRETTGAAPRAALSKPAASPRPGRSAASSAPRPGTPPALAPARSVVRVTPFDIALWAARGGGVVIVGGASLRLRTGEIAVLPAGHPHEIVVDPDSVLLPVASRPPGRGAPLEELRVASGHARLRAVLLHSSAVSYTQLKSPGYDPSELFDALLHDSRRAPAESTVADVSRIARITHGARLLREGCSVAHTARVVGYSHPSAFARAFRAHHGMAPSQFRLAAEATGSSATLAWLRPGGRSL